MATAAQSHAALRAQWRDRQISRAEYERALAKLPPETLPAENDLHVSGCCCRCCGRYIEGAEPLSVCESCEEHYA